MRSRALPVLVSLVLATAACGQGPAVSGEEISLRYAFQPGEELTYNTDLGMSAEFVGEGDFGVPGGLEMSMEMDLAARTDYEITEGPDPETVRLTISTEIIGGGGTIETQGITRPIPFDEVTRQAGSLDVEIVIDAQGRVVEMVVGGRALPPGLLENLGGLGGSSPFGGFDPSTMLGPELPDGPIRVGERWTTEVSDDTLGLGVTARSEHVVAGTEVVAGHDTYRIETVTTTEAMEFTFEELMRLVSENWEAFGEALGDEVSAADLEAALSMFETLGIEMDYRLDRSVAESTTWLDAAEGIVVRMEMTGPQHMFMAMRGVPDTGDFSLDMDMTMTVTMQLAG